MGFNIKNNYGPLIDNHDGGVVNLRQHKNGTWNTDNIRDAEEAEVVEEITDETAAAPEGERKRPFSSAVVCVEKVDAIVGLLCQLMEGKTKPKDVMMPIRAAMDAGVIRRPTWEEFCSEFGEDRVKSKASFSDYTNPGKKPYVGADFDAMKVALQAL